MDLADLWRGTLSLRKASILVAQLPAGARTWQSTGGAAAWSEEVHSLMVLDLRLRELFWAKTEDAEKGKNPPKIVEPPPFEDEVEKTTQEVDAKARRFQELQQKREARRAASAQQT